MEKSGNTTTKPQTGGSGNNKGDGGRRPPVNPQTPTPKEDRSSQGDPGMKPPKSNK